MVEFWEHHRYRGKLTSTLMLSPPAILTVGVFQRQLAGQGNTGSGYLDTLGHFGYLATPSNKNAFTYLLGLFRATLYGLDHWRESSEPILVLHNSPQAAGFIELWQAGQLEYPAATRQSPSRPSKSIRQLSQLLARNPDRITTQLVPTNESNPLIEAANQIAEESVYIVQGVTTPSEGRSNVKKITYNALENYQNQRQPAK